MPALVFRLLWDGAESGARNMARDEALLDGVLRGSPPTLRLYGWRKPTLSLGYFQQESPVSPGRLREAGVDLVRRPTGGSAVLHQHEVTYSLALPVSLLPTGSADIARFLGEGLAGALGRLGLRTTLNELAPPKAPLCFTIPGLYEPVVGGRKVVGSARRRRRGALLEHGSFLLRDPDRLDLLPESGALRERSISLLALLGATPAEAEVRWALVRGFLERFAAGARPGALLPWEQEREAVLLQSGSSKRNGMPEG